jgi:hypothetical protein
MQPQFALVEVDGGFVVEKFDAKHHISPFGWSYPNVSLFDHVDEVSHLRDQILN